MNFLQRISLHSFTFFSYILRAMIILFALILFVVQGGFFTDSSQKVFASDDRVNISSSNFTINLQELDPISHGPKGGDGKENRVYETGWKGLFQKLAQSISNLLLMIIPLLAGISLIIAGYFYIFSASDGEMISKAKNIIKYNLLAMGVAFLSYVIISILAGFFTTL